MPKHPSRLPDHQLPFLMAGGLLLAGIAGYVNVVVIALGGPPVTHVTGTVSRLSADLGRADVNDALFVLSLVASFIAGAGVSGFVLGTQTLRLGRRYGVAVLIEAVLLGSATVLFPHAFGIAVLLAAGAAGLQNGMASSYRHLILRTTHVTGIATDLGFELGRRLAGHRVEAWHFVLLLGLLLAFGTGGVLGAFAHRDHGVQALTLPTALLAAAGFSYFGWRRISGFAHRSAR
ncbi:MAG: DUF1275 family protein [Phycisphaeraceae bacterium]|nr:MAG: DUF1275 family protein [Phycisphaeraceae bacterium]